MRTLLLAVLVIILPRITTAQSISPVNALIGDGGSVTTELGGGIAVNDGSSLHRRWITLRDSRLPLNIVGTTGPKTRYSGDRGYHFFAPFDVEASEPISAYEVRILIFSVWGDLLRIQVQNFIKDTPGGAGNAQMEWYERDETEVAYVHSLTYISRVLTQSGRVLRADDAAVLTEAKRISSRLKPEDLTVKPKTGT